jgi:hypothetical protein
VFLTTPNSIKSEGCVNFKIEFEREDDGRWIAEIHDLPGVMAYGATKDEAEAAVEALALRVIAYDSRFLTAPSARFGMTEFYF